MIVENDDLICDAGPPLPPLRVLAAVALGGAIGSTLRVGVGFLLPTMSGEIPWGTLSENLLGAFLLGVAVVAFQGRWRAWRSLQPFLCAGVLSSFTTFSNFSVELLQLGSGGHGWLALAYTTAAIGLGLPAAFAGMRAARLLTGAREPNPREEIE